MGRHWTRCGSTYTVDQVRFVTMLVNELTANGVVEPRRLYESPYTDTMPQGPDAFFPDGRIIVIAGRLRTVKEHALAESTSA